MGFPIKRAANADAEPPASAGVRGSLAQTVNWDGKSSENQNFAPSHGDMLKRGGREGPNVTNPTLTHDRPNKLFAFLGALPSL